MKSAFPSTHPAHLRPPGQSRRGEAAAPYHPHGRADPARSAHLSAVWGRNRNLCVNVLIHGHLCVCGFGGCRRIAHRYTFICQESVRNSGCGSPKIPGLDGTPRRPVHRTSGRDGPDPAQCRGSSLMYIHRSHLCHIGEADQGHFLSSPEIPGSPGFRRATQNWPTTALRRMAILAVSEGGLPACRKATRTASLPQTPFSSPTQPNRPGRRTHQSRGERVGWFVKTSSSVLTISL
jgi:hypothetical protein